MQKRPSIKALIAESHQFFWENRDWALVYSMPLIIPIVIFSGLHELAGYYYPIFWIFGLGVVYLYACFILSWHRACLITPRAEHKVSPLCLKPGEGKFILTLCALGLAPLLVMLCASIPVFLGDVIGGDIGILIGALLVVFVWVYGGIKLARCFFVLPAKAINVAMSLKEADRVSRGFLLPFLVSLSLFIAVWLAVMVLPTFIVTVLNFNAYVQSSSDDLDTEVVDIFSFRTSVMIFIFVTLPSIPLWFYTIALNVGVLSRLYQGAVRERG